MIKATGLHALILQIAQGSDVAFETLYNSMHAPLSRYVASKFSGQLSQTDIEDITQYTFLQILLRANTYRGKHTDNSAKKWIFTIARNRAFKVLKILSTLPVSMEAYRPNASEPDLPALEYEFPAQDNTEKEAINTLLIETVIRICTSLSRRDREMLVMRFEEKRTLKEIGNRYNLSSPRIKQIVDHILEMLYRTLQ